MSLEVLREIEQYFFMITIVCVAITVILFFRFQIWKVIGDLSGVNAKREIKLISERRIKKHGNEILEWNYELERTAKNRTDTLVEEEEMGCLDADIEPEKFCLVEKMEYFGSEEWIE